MIAIEEEQLSFYQWLLAGNDTQIAALLWFLIVVACLSLFGLVVGYLAAAVRHGRLTAGDVVYRTVMTGFRELAAISPRRVWALTVLAIKESVRRWVVIGVVIYLVLLGFAGWFLDSAVPDPVTLYLSFTLTATTYLILLLALFLSAFSLPGDFKNRTIYTVVTKPVYAGEIVLGRILGFTLVGTASLAVMGVFSYFFVVRALNHTHTIDTAQLEEVTGSGGSIVGQKGVTSKDHYHRHEVVIEENGEGVALSEVGHSHRIRPVTVDGETQYEVQRPGDMFQARVPHVGELRFLDRAGQPTERGISVGNEWDYRRYVQGGTQAAAIWTFQDVSEEKYPEGLPLELYIRVFRSHKGEIEEGILGSIQLRNPVDDTKRSNIMTFRARDAYIDEHFIPRDLTDSKGRPISLYDDLVHDEKIEVWIQCLDAAQYFGVAQADLYIRQEGGLFEVNLLKGYAGVWVQMVLVICLGVLFSTFLSAPVAMVATLGCVVLGFFTEFILGIVRGEIPGGGPFESLIRTITQANVMVELEPSFGVTVAQTLDKVALFFMGITIRLLPDFASYDQVSWVAKGFNIRPELVAQHFASALGYVVGVSVAGYFFLRLREVAK